MLYAISGCSSSGKSTLIGALEEHYYVIRKQYARDLLKDRKWTIDDVRSSEESLDSFHLAFLGIKQCYERIFSKIDDHRSHANSPVFTERAFLDVFVFYALYYEKYYQCSFLNHLFTNIVCDTPGSTLLSCQCSLTETEMKLFSFFQKCLYLDSMYYTKIYYLSQTPNIEYDSIRITSVDLINNQKDVFLQIHDHIPWYKEHLVVIDDLSVDARMNHVIAAL
jgi:hypothetical protein